MHMRQLASALADVFTQHGYESNCDAALEGRSGMVYTCPLLVERQGRAYILDGRLSGVVVDARAVQSLLATAEDLGANGAILCHLAARTPDAAAAGQGRVVLWDQDLLIRILGEARLAAALDMEPNPLPLDAADVSGPLVAESVSELLPPAFRAEPQADPDPEPQPEPEPVETAWESSDGDLARLLGAPEPEPLAAMVHEPYAASAASSSPTASSHGHPAAEAAREALAHLAAMMAEQRAPAPHPSPPMWSPPPVPTAPPAAPLAWGGPIPAASGSLAAEPAAAAFAPAAFAPAAPAAAAFATAGAAPALPLTLDVDPLPFSDRPRTVPASQVAGLAPPSQLPPPPPPPTAILPVRLTVEDSHRKVKDRLFSIERHELVLQPVHLFDYECDLLAEGSLKFDTVDGRVQVHGTDRAASDVDPDLANPNGPSLLASTLGQQVVEKVLRITPERAQQVAQAHVAKKHTRMVDVQIPDDDRRFYYTEKRKVEPRPDHIRLRHVGVFHRPVWRLWGANGHVDVDALDGRLLEAQLRNANSDSMLLE